MLFCLVIRDTRRL